jgi:hypothetical protein
MADLMLGPEHVADVGQFHHRTAQARAQTNDRPPPARTAAGSTTPAPAGTTPEVRAAQESLHSGQFDEGSAGDARARLDEERKQPAKGSSAAVIAEKKAELETIPDDPPGARAARIEQMKEEAKERAKLFGEDKMNAATAALTPAEAAEQRIGNARKLMLELEALGMTPEQAGLDPRMIDAARKQQQMVDALAEQAADLSPEQLALAQEAQRQRQLSREDPSKVSAADAESLRARMAAAAGSAVDGMPVEKRLLLHGFTPDEIADHFTSRDKDADVLQDPNHPEHDTAARGTTDPTVVAGGDRNPDGTTRRPMTLEEADRAVDVNQVLDESWKEGARFGKIIPPNAAAKYASGAWGAKLSGDIGAVENTEQPAGADPAQKGLHQIRAAGLDYNQSPYAADKDNPTQPAQFVKDNQVHRVEGTVNEDLANKAQVCMGNAVYARAAARAGQLETARQATGGDASDIWIPKMLRTDASAATGDPDDALPGVMNRQRGNAGGAPENDPRTGLGFSETLLMNMGVVPNQERNIASSATVAVPSDTQVTRSDRAGPELVYDPATGKLVPPPAPAPGS